MQSRMTPHSSGSLVRIERRHLAGLLELDALVHDQRRVAAVVDDQRRAGAVGPLERLVRAPPVLFERLALPREHRRALRVLRGAAGFRAADHDRRGRVILRREDVARDPAHVGAELGQRLDQHGGLNRHVQAAHDARAGERLLRAVLRAERHQAGHLLLGEADFLAAELGERQVLHLVRLAAGRLRGGERMQLLSHSRHLFSFIATHESSNARQSSCLVRGFRGILASCCDEQPRSLRAWRPAAVPRSGRLRTRRR